MGTRLTPSGTGRTIVALAWALAAGVGIDFAAILILFATGP